MDLSQRVALLTRLEEAIKDTEQEIEFYRKGELCSLAESAAGEIFYNKFLKTLTWIRDGDSDN